MDIDFLKQPTLYEKLLEWYQTMDACQSSPVIVYDLVKVIEDWLPRNQTYSGSQLPVDQEAEIDAYNSALDLVKSRLRRW